MLVLLHRRYRLDGYSIGKLYVNGQYVCDTLEDTDRGLDDDMPEKEIIRKKVYGKTAIPTGMYHVSMDTVSSKFRSRVWAKPYGGCLPRIQSVKGFNGVLIHVGNKPDDTLGCVLVGRNTIKGQLTESAKTFFRLMDDYLAPAASRGEDIIISIEY